MASKACARHKGNSSLLQDISKGCSRLHPSTSTGHCRVASPLLGARLASPLSHLVCEFPVGPDAVRA